VRSTAPLGFPQKASLTEVLTVKPEGSVIVVEVIVVQEFPSVIVTVYTPALIPVLSSVKTPDPQLYE
jgi:hypothetical protein